MTEMEKFVHLITKYSMRHEIVDGIVYLPSYANVRTSIGVNAMGMLTFSRWHGRRPSNIYGHVSAKYLFAKINPQDAEREGIDIASSCLPPRLESTPTPEDVSSARMTQQEKDRKEEERKNTLESMGRWFTDGY